MLKNLKYVALMAPTLLILAQEARAQALPFSVEGVTTDITQELDANSTPTGNYILTCGIMKTVITPATLIRSPTRVLTLTELIDITRSFPNGGVSPTWGVDRAGFVGGGCVADGDVDGANYPARNLWVQVDESVAVGVVTQVPTTTLPLKINGIVINDLLGDSRMQALRTAAGFYDANGQPLAGAPTETIISNEGFGVDATKAAPRSVAAANGYFGDDGTFKSFSTIVDGKLSNPTPRASITKAAAAVTLTGKVGSDSVKIVGGCVMTTTTATIELSMLLPAPRGVVDANGNPPPASWTTAGTTTCTAIALAAGIAPAAPTRVGKYGFVNNKMTLGGAVPLKYRARILNGTRYDFYTPPR